MLSWSDLLDGLLADLPSRDGKRRLFQNVLAHYIKPLFTASAHPRLNLDTGRTLAKPAGGVSAGQDMYQDQVWKRIGQGCWNVLSWCLNYLDVRNMPLLCLILPIEVATCSRS